MISFIPLKTVENVVMMYAKALQLITFIADADIDADGGPNVDHDPDWQNDTTLHFNGQPINAQEVAYGVIPIGVLNLVAPKGLGCQIYCTNLKTGQCSAGVLADLGPTRKIGEISPAMARNIGINPNSVSGGEDDLSIRYDIYLGRPAVYGGRTYKLQVL